MIAKDLTPSIENVGAKYAMPFLIHIQQYCILCYRIQAKIIGHIQYSQNKNPESRPAGFTGSENIWINPGNTDWIQIQVSKKSKIQQVFQNSPPYTLHSINIVISRIYFIITH